MTTILTTILKGLLTEAFLKKIIISLLTFLASKTDNTLDDELVTAIKESLK